MTETTLHTEGQRPHRVRVYATVTRTGTAVVRVEWREASRRVREARPDTRDNRTWAKRRAKEVNARLVLGQQRTTRTTAKTLKEVVAHYHAHNAHWRPKTLVGSANKLKVWLAYAKPHTLITAVTPELVDDFRLALRETPRGKTGVPMAASQIQRHVNAVKALVRFAKARKYLTENPLAEYEVRLGKDERPLDVPEYSNDDWGAVLAQLSPRDARQWRAWALIVLGGVVGPRQTALRSLVWDDLDLTARTVTWRAETDKVGKLRVQPLPRDAVYALRVAKVWRRRDGYAGPFVFYAVKRSKRDTQPYTYSALNYQLHEAERRAGVVAVKYKAMHGLRRTSMGNALEAAGGNLKEAMQWIGDDDLKSAQKYLKRREAHQQALARKMGAPSPTATEQPTARKRVTTQRRKSR